MISPTLSRTRTTLALTFSWVCVVRRRRTVGFRPLNVDLNGARAFIAHVRPLAEYAHGSCIQLLCADSQFTLGPFFMPNSCFVLRASSLD
jgi:hypothetical protein